MQDTSRVAHPFLFALFPILFLFSHNRAEFTSLSEIVPSVVLVLGGAGLLFLLAFAVLRDFQRAGFALSVFLILFFNKIFYVSEYQ